LTAAGIDRRFDRVQVGAVVVGFDRYINYYKIQMATLCIRENPGCIFIATNTGALGRGGVGWDGGCKGARRAAGTVRVSAV